MWKYFADKNAEDNINDNRKKCKKSNNDTQKKTIEEVISEPEPSTSEQERWRNSYKSLTFIFVRL